VRCDVYSKAGNCHKGNIMDNSYCIIMAGGKGERFWPLSTRRVPKPFVKLMNNRSMIQLTVERIQPLIPTDRIFIVVGAQHAEVARQQLSQFHKDQFIIEPVGRDTAPCIGFAATMLKKKDPEAVMVVLPADHYIPDIEAFVSTISTCIRHARSGGFLITAGVMPTRPETGYGYIHTGTGVGDGSDKCFEVDRFVEKPDLTKAIHYLEEGNYFWNSGIFVWRVSALLDGMETHMPDLRKNLFSMESAIDQGNIKEVDAIFRTFPKISIDYGLMEKAANVRMVKAHFSWDDVGTWSSLKRVMDLDSNGNYISGKPVCLDTADCVIYSDDIRLGVVGVSNLVIVASKEGMLVCSLSRDQDTRKIAQVFDDECETTQ
jgi:mannose-1-phosphate guanylyltransferase